MPDQFGGVEIEDEFGGIAVEEESTPPEREDYISPPPPVFVGKPEVLVEGRTVERLPASLEVPEPARVIEPFSMDEFTRGDVATPEQRAFTAAQPSEYDRPVIPPGVFKTALDIGTLTMPRTELMEGFKEGTAEQLAGMTSQASAAMLPAFAAPYVGPALAMGMGAKALGAGAGKTVAGIESGEQREIGAGLSEVLGGAGMLAGGGVAARARPASPPRIVEAMAKGDAAGLTKATQTLADVVREQPKEEVASAEAIRSDPGQVREAGRQPEIVQDQGRENLQQPAPEPSQPVGAQAGQSAEVLLTGPEVIKSIVELPDAEAGALKQKPAVEAGIKLTEADVPALEVARDAAMNRAVEFAEAGNNEAFKANFGRNIWFSGAIEGARRKGPNYDTFIEQQKAAAPTPPEAVSRGPVSDKPAGQPAVAGAEAVPAQVAEWNGRPLSYWKSIAVPQKLGKGEFRTGLARTLGVADNPKSVATALQKQIAALEPVGARVEPFFERESEVAGLGRSSLPPTVADVRAQRVADTSQRAADAAAESGYVPDTRGETVKMRKSAERAVESPQIPEPVQERIEAAPESRYTQQSMARVEDAVKSLSDADLAAMPAESNLFVASKLEQADRRFRAGDNDGGYAIFVELEKQGTSFGQNINQFKRLAGTRPEYVATVIDKHLTKAGKDALTPEQRATAIETTRKSKEADLVLDKATDAWTEKPTAENAHRAEAALDKANAEAVELQKFVAKFEPRSTSGILKSVLQGNLLTPISEVANLFGNMSFLPFRAGTRAVATGLDMIDAALRNKPRELSVQPLAGTAEALKGVGRGVAKIPDILIEGTGNVIKGETRAGLHPVKAWINQFAKNPEMPTMGGKITLQDRLNLAIEGTFGVSAEAMLRGLGSGDVPFKEGARARVTAEQLRLNNVPRGQWPFAQKFPELFLNKKALDQIHADTMAAVFQRESKTLNYLTNLAKSKGELLDFFVATVAPYKLTPWNIVAEILSYNPLVALTHGLIDAKKGNTRAAKLNAGKLVVGSMLTGAGLWLYNKGLLAPSLDQRDEAQKGRVLAGEVLPPNHINISGLTRALKPGAPPDAAHFRPGDETADIMRGGGLAGSIFYMTANIGRDFERQPEVDQSDMWLSILRQSTLEQARFGMNQSFLSGVEGLLTAIKDGNSDNYVRQWANTVASIPLPNTLNTISRASREYKPDVSKDFPAQIKSKLGVFGLDDYLPLKRDFWGEPMRETPEGRDAIFYHFFDISKNKQVTSDPVELELYRLWRKTANSEVIPSIPTRKLTIENQEYPLTPNLYEKYAEVVGRNRREIVDAMVINPNFHELTDEQKIDVLERAYRDGLARGKALFYQEHQGALVPKAGRAGFTP